MECVSSLTDFYHFPCGKYGFLFFDSWWNRNMLCLSAESWWYKMCSRISGLFIKQQFLLKIIYKYYITSCERQAWPFHESLGLQRNSHPLIFLKGLCNSGKRRFSYRIAMGHYGGCVKNSFPVSSTILFSLFSWILPTF